MSIPRDILEKIRLFGDIICPKNIYPCTVIKPRYGYPTDWLAFRATEDEIDDFSEHADTGDYLSFEWWKQYEVSAPYPVGRGDTPNEAVENLCQEVMRWQFERGYEVGV